MVASIKKPLEKVQPLLLEARDGALSEADTVQRIVQFFEDVLGYGPKDLTRDKAVEHTWVDLAIKLGDDVPLLIEVVAAGTALSLGHIAEARRVAARDNVSFILLTNAVTFNLYHVTLDEDLEIALAFSVNVGGEISSEAVELLGVLHRRSVAGGGLQAFWEQRARLGPAVLGRALFSAGVLRGIQQRLREDEDIRVDTALLAASLHEMLSEETRWRIGAVPAQRHGSAADAKPVTESGSAPHVVEAPDDAPHIVDAD